MRFTRINPDRKTYRIWLDHAGDNSARTQAGTIFMFGDIADRMGKFEDLLEKLAKLQNLPKEVSDAVKELSK